MLPCMAALPQAQQRAHYIIIDWSALCNTWCSVTHPHCICAAYVLHFIVASDSIGEGPTSTCNNIDGATPNWLPTLEYSLHCYTLLYAPCTPCSISSALNFQGMTMLVTPPHHTTLVREMQPLLAVSLINATQKSGVFTEVSGISHVCIASRVFPVPMYATPSCRWSPRHSACDRSRYLLSDAATSVLS